MIAYMSNLHYDTINRNMYYDFLYNNSNFFKITESTLNDLAKVVSYRIRVKGEMQILNNLEISYYDFCEMSDKNFDGYKKELLKLAIGLKIIG